MRNPLMERGAVEEFQGRRQACGAEAIELPADGHFALSAALSAQAGADSGMGRTEQVRPSVRPPGRCHRATAVTSRLVEAWASRRRKRNAESRRR
jgi:hypothetical protein